MSLSRVTPPGILKGNSPSANGPGPAGRWRTAIATAWCAVANRLRSSLVRLLPTAYVPSLFASRHGPTAVRRGRVVVEKRSAQWLVNG